MLVAQLHTKEKPVFIVTWTNKKSGMSYHRELFDFHTREPIPEERVSEMVDYANKNYRNAVHSYERKM